MRKLSCCDAHRTEQGPVNRPRAWPCAAAALAAALVVAVAESRFAAAAAAPNGNEFLVVDCLLPAQIRKMGKALTFLAPRQAIRTPARDCEIRGGEYVAYDRADYGTSLKIWLEQAEAGSASAANNVGQVFEIGFRDYASAATWYRKAAENGDNRAKINLGLLYERGLGVAKDMATALKWYRSAAGADAAIVADAQAASQSQAKIENLQREVTDLRAELAATVQDRRALQSDLDDKRRKAEASRREVERLKTAVSASQPGRTAGGDAEARLATTEARLKAKEHELSTTAAGLAQRETALRDLQQRLTEREQVIAVQKQQLASLTEESRGDERDRARRAAAIRDLEAEVASLRSRLGEQTKVVNGATAAVSKGRQEADRLRHEVTQLEKELASLRARPDRSAEVTELEQTLRKRETELSKSRSEMDALRAKIVEAEKKSKSYEERLAKITATGDVSMTRTGRDGVAEKRPLIMDNKLVSSLNFGQYHALVIGNSKYKELPKLTTTIADANSVADVLSQKYGFEVTKLIDADRYSILSALNKYRESLTQDDNLLIYYAGHGELDTVNQRGYWLPVDAERSSNANWISATAITDILNVMSARHVLVVSDSCYAGIMTRSVLSDLQPGQNLDAQAAWVAAIVRKRSRTVLTSGGVAPVIDGGGGNHSVFARAFLEALNGNHDVLAAQKLYADVSRRVSLVTSSLRVDQVPVYAPLPHAGHELGEFLFVPLADNGRETARIQ